MVNYCHASVIVSLTSRVTSVINAHDVQFLQLPQSIHNYLHLLYIIIYNIILIYCSPNCSFFMAATYFSSSERRLDRGFGLAAVFLEHSASFRSISEIKYRFIYLLSKDRNIKCYIPDQSQDQSHKIPPNGDMPVV